MTDIEPELFELSSKRQAVMLAYGLLWLVRDPSILAMLARVELRDLLTKDELSAGIIMARAKIKGMTNAN